jgi:hypothetical protein
MDHIIAASEAVGLDAGVPGRRAGRRAGRRPAGRRQRALDDGHGADGVQPADRDVRRRP